MLNGPSRKLGDGTHIGRQGACFGAAPSPRRAENWRRPLDTYITAATIAIFGIAPTVLFAPMGCAGIVRPAPFQGARDHSAQASLVGPFDGQVTDANTGEPISDALVVGVWSYDEGEGFSTPAGSHVVQVLSDEAGRYRIPAAPSSAPSVGSGNATRLVSFRLIVYKRGYRAYRSDRLLDGTPRSDFVQRHNAAALEKWQANDSHAEHLMFLAPTRDLAQSSSWERRRANLDLYVALGGRTAVAKVSPRIPTRTTVSPSDEAAETQTSEAAPQWLDASELITTDEVKNRTGSYEDFVIGELQDLPRTATYHGVHHRAVDAEATSDFAYRVWTAPSGGLEELADTFRSNLPGVAESDEVTDRTWLFENEELRAVAFLDEDAAAGVLLTCGVELCVDLETAVILAKLIQGRLDRITSIDAIQASDAETPATEPATPPTDDDD